MYSNHHGMLAETKEQVLPILQWIKLGVYEFHNLCLIKYII